MPALFDRLGHHLRLQSSHKAAATATVLAATAGMCHGWNYTCLGLLLLVNIVRVPLALVCGAFVAGCAGALVAAPWVAQWGKWLLDGTAWGELVAMCGEGPLSLLLGWDQPAIAGGLVCGPVLGLALFLAARPLCQAAAACGGQPTTAGWIRRQHPLGIATPWLLAIGLAWLPLERAQHDVERILLERLSLLNGAEVSAATTQVSLWQGTARLTGVQVPDPADLNRNRWQIAQIEATLRPWLLLRGVLDIQTAAVTGVEMDVARKTAAEPCAMCVTHEPAPLVNELAVESVQGLDLDQCVRDAHGLFMQGARVQAFLNWLGQVRSWETKALAECPTLANHRSWGASRATLSIGTLKVEGFSTAFGLGDKCLLELTGLTSGADTGAECARLECTAPDFATNVRLELNASGDAEPHQLRWQSFGVPLAALLSANPAGRELAIEEGKATLWLEGPVTAEGLHLKVTFEAEEMAVALGDQGPVAGLSAATWNQALARLGTLQGACELIGPWSNPQLVVDGTQLADQLRYQLRITGDVELADSINRQLLVAAAGSADRYPEFQVAAATPAGITAAANAEVMPAVPAGGGFALADDRNSKRAAGADGHGAAKVENSVQSVVVPGDAGASAKTAAVAAKSNGSADAVYQSPSYVSPVAKNGASDTGTTAGNGNPSARTPPASTSAAAALGAGVRRTSPGYPVTQTPAEDPAPVIGEQAVPIRPAPAPEYPVNRMAPSAGARDTATVSSAPQVAAKTAQVEKASPTARAAKAASTAATATAYNDYRSPPVSRPVTSQEHPADSSPKTTAPRDGRSSLDMPGPIDMEIGYDEEPLVRRGRSGTGRAVAGAASAQAPGARTPRATPFSAQGFERADASTETASAPLRASGAPRNSARPGTTGRDPFLDRTGSAAGPAVTGATNGYRRPSQSPATYVPPTAGGIAGRRPPLANRNASSRGEAGYAPGEPIDSDAEMMAELEPAEADPAGSAEAPRSESGLSRWSRGVSTRFKGMFRRGDQAAEESAEEFSSSAYANDELVDSEDGEYLGPTESEEEVLAREAAEARAHRAAGDPYGEELEETADARQPWYKRIFR